MPPPLGSTCVPEALLRMAVKGLFERQGLLGVSTGLLPLEMVPVRVPVGLLLLLRPSCPPGLFARSLAGAVSRAPEAGRRTAFVPAAPSRSGLMAAPEPERRKE